MGDGEPDQAGCAREHDREPEVTGGVGQQAAGCREQRDITGGGRSAGGGGSPYRRDRGMRKSNRRAGGNYGEAAEECGDQYQEADRGLVDEQGRWRSARG